MTKNDQESIDKINFRKGILATIGCSLLNLALGEFALLPQIYPYMVSYFHLYNSSIHLSQMKYISMIYLFTQTTTMALTFYLFNLLNYRGVFFLSILCFSSSQILASFFTNYWIFLPVYSILSGCSKAIYILPIYCVWRYFPAKYKPILSGIMLSGNALSSAPSSTLAHWYINPGNKEPIHTAGGDFFPEDVARNVPKFFRLLGVISFVMGVVGVFLVTEPAGEEDGGQDVDDSYYGTIKSDEFGPIDENLSKDKVGSKNEEERNTENQEPKDEQNEENSEEEEEKALEIGKKEDGESSTRLSSLKGTTLSIAPTVFNLTEEEEENPSSEPDQDRVEFTKTKIKQMKTEDFRVFKDKIFQSAYFNLMFTFLFPLFFNFCFKEIALDHHRTDLDIVNSGVIASLFNALGRFSGGILFKAKGYRFTAYAIMTVQAFSALSYSLMCSNSITFTISLCVTFWGFGATLGLYPLVSDLLFKDKGAFSYSMLFTSFSLGNCFVLMVGSWAKHTFGSWSLVMYFFGLVVLIPIRNIWKLNLVILKKQGKGVVEEEDESEDDEEVLKEED